MLTYIITLLSQCVNELINVFIVFYCLLKFARNIENIKYYIRRHITSSENCVSCKPFYKFSKPVLQILLNNFIKRKDVTGFVNCLCLFDFNVCRCATLTCR